MANTYNASVTITSVDLVLGSPQLLVRNGKGKFTVDGDRHTLVLESGEIVNPLREGAPVFVNGVATVNPPAIGAFWIHETMGVEKAELPAVFEGPLLIGVKGVQEQAAGAAK